jgi:hypothetical protein
MEGVMGAVKWLGAAVGVVVTGDDNHGMFDDGGGGGVSRQINSWARAYYCQPLPRVSLMRSTVLKWVPRW